MTDTIHNIEIDGAPNGSPLAVAGDLVLAVRSPRSSNSVTVMIGPAVSDFQETVGDAPAGLEVRNALVLESTDETVQGLIRTGDANAKYFRLRQSDYRLVLLSVGTVSFEGQEFPRYTFLAEEQPEGRAAERSQRRMAVLQDHTEATKAGDLEAVIRTAAVFRESVECELSPSLGDLRRLAHMAYNRAVAFRETVNREAEREAYDWLLASHLRTHPDGVIQERVCNGLYARAYTFLEDEMFEKAVQDLEDLDRVYSGVEVMDARILVAKALVNRIGALSALDREANAKSLAQTVIDRYGSQTEPELVRQVDLARAFLNSGS